MLSGFQSKAVRVADGRITLISWSRCGEPVRVAVRRAGFKGDGLTFDITGFPQRIPERVPDRSVVDDADAQDFPGPLLRRPEALSTRGDSSGAPWLKLANEIPRKYSAARRRLNRRAPDCTHRIL